jgi:hypothetical protein
MSFEDREAVSERGRVSLITVGKHSSGLDESSIKDVIEILHSSRSNRLNLGGRDPR